MSNYKRMIVMQGGVDADSISIHDGQGNQVDFISFENFSRCTGIDTTGMFRVNYEPEKNMFSNSNDPSVNSGMIPYAPYEDLIAMMPVIEARKNDPFYGIPPAELPALAMENHASRASTFQSDALEILREHEDRVARGLPGLLSPAKETEFAAYLFTMQAIMDSPSADPNFFVTLVPVVA